MVAKGKNSRTSKARSARPPNSAQRNSRRPAEKLQQQGCSDLERLLELIKKLNGLEVAGPTKFRVECFGFVVEIHKGSNPLQKTILFMGANPSDETHLALTSEARKIDDKLRSSDRRDVFRVVQHWQVQAAEVPGLIMRQKPVIVHFSGHGSTEGALVFHGADGTAQVADKAALTTIFRVLSGVRCVVLNCCYSTAQAKEVVKHIDAVVGMKSAIGDKSAIAFASAFYESLGYDKSVQEAFELAKASITLSGLSDADLPQLHARRRVDLSRLYI